MSFRIRGDLTGICRLANFKFLPYGPRPHISKCAVSKGEKRCQECQLRTFPKIWMLFLLFFTFKKSCCDELEPAPAYELNTGWLTGSEILPLPLESSSDISTEASSTHSLSRWCDVLGVVGSPAVMRVRLRRTNSTVFWTPLFICFLWIPIS